MGAGGIEVAVEFFHALFFVTEEVVEFLLLYKGEVEPDFRNGFKAFIEVHKLSSEVIEGLLQRAVGIVVREAVNPLFRRGHAVEDEPAEETILCIGYEGFDLFRRAGQDYCQARAGDFALLAVVASAEVAEFFMGESLAEVVGVVAVVAFEGVDYCVSFGLEHQHVAVVCHCLCE